MSKLWRDDRDDELAELQEWLAPRWADNPPHPGDAREAMIQRGAHDPPDLERGTQVAYIPDHAEGNIDHPDVEYGFVTSVRINDAFCRYWSRGIGDLRTKSCSELTPMRNLQPINSRPQEVIKKALERWCPV